MTEMDLRRKNLGATPIGEIAAQAPGAAAIFRQYKLDYCCAGGTSLAEAAEKRNLDLTEIERQLGSLIPQANALPDEPSEIIELIVARYHNAHRRELPELIDLARRVERVHADHPEAPKGLAHFLERMLDELLKHMEKEEAILFPMMRARHPMVSAPMAVMRAEHAAHGDALAELAASTNDFQPPSDACNSWRALYVGLKKLSDDLMEHIHIENNILFPRFVG